MSIWYNKEQIYELTTPVAIRIMKSIRQKKINEARDLCDLLKEERIVLHDLFADFCVALFTWIGRNLGEERLQDMFIFCFEQSARRQLYDLYDPALKRGLEAFLIARDSWVAHSCSGAGEHGGAFRLEEDDEKFTFILDPCGSGGRLWRKHRYEAPFDFSVTEHAYPWSYDRKGFPYYCIHCFFMNELLPYRHLGYINWPVDPPEHPMDVCRWYLYKDFFAVPEKYYARSGLSKPAGDRNTNAGGKRWFSQVQLTEMIRPTPDRIRERLDRGYPREALKIASQAKGEFFFLHSLYVNLLVTTLDFIVQEAGEDSLNQALTYVYDACVRKQIIAKISELPREDCLAFIIRNIFLADTCGGAGLPAPRITIEEDTTEVRIVLNPCASGGKLIRRRSYEPLKASAAFREKIENRLMKLSMRVPFPRRLLEFFFPIVIDYINEFRKAEGIGMTHKAHPWSSGRSSLPYYCCFCKVFLKEANCDWLEINPPSGFKDPCVWYARKA
jgi:hypothetical protein